MPNAHSTVPAPLLEDGSGGFGEADATPPPTGGVSPDSEMAGTGATSAGVWSAIVWSAGWFETGAGVPVVCRGASAAQGLERKLDEMVKG